MTENPWSSGEAYERFMGRWSRIASASFVRWLDRPAHRVWVDVGMGTGALTQSILDRARPSAVIGVEPSPDFRRAARSAVVDPRAVVVAGDALSIPIPDAGADIVASAFMLNFVPDARAALREMARCVPSGGVVAAVVWDYAEGMQFLRHFWSAAAALDPGAVEWDEGVRFPICRPGELRRAFAASGFIDIRLEPIEIETRFVNLVDLWEPFLGGTGPAPGYLATLPAPQRDRLRGELARRVPVEDDGSIELHARGWAIEGRTRP